MKERTKLIVSVMAVIIVGLILMAATGLIVYYGFCQVDTTDMSSSRLLSRATGRALPASSTDAGQTGPQRLHPALLHGTKDDRPLDRATCTGTMDRRATDESDGPRMGDGLSAQLDGPSQRAHPTDGTRRGALRPRDEPAQLPGALQDVHHVPLGSLRVPALRHADQGDGQQARLQIHS
ncbi:hypothetical protein GHT06_019977 [Daphnia sinensis]|uniref:Uncharacterized protein n=1 Tax=Daphnia sinensis TaxID=1820382 RepID=A0AAD5PP36_9CRUS|nr:hypothetical protein GHT06_019977 [Daphnia sinensis]